MQPSFNFGAGAFQQQYNNTQQGQPQQPVPQPFQQQQPAANQSTGQQPQATNTTSPQQTGATDQQKQTIINNILQVQNNVKELERQMVILNT